MRLIIDVSFTRVTVYEAATSTSDIDHSAWHVPETHGSFLFRMPIPFDISSNNVSSFVLSLSWRFCMMLYHLGHYRPALLLLIIAKMSVIPDLSQVYSSKRRIAQSWVIKVFFFCTLRVERSCGKSFARLISISPFPCLQILSVGSLREEKEKRERKASLKSYQCQSAIDKTFTETPGSSRHRVPKH